MLGSKEKDKNKPPSKINLSASHTLHLKAAWRKAFSQLEFDGDQVQSKNAEGEKENKKSVNSIHNQNVKLNHEILNDREAGTKSMGEYLNIRELQINGWQFDKPTAKEILTIKPSPTARQKSCSHVTPTMST